MSPVAFVRLAARVCALLTFALAASPALAQHTDTRRCFGLIWCTEVKADGTTATDGLLFLYSSERKGDDSRMTIRPFYAREDAPSRGYLRRSVLWPLGSYERDKDRVSSHVAPLYWHGEEPNLRYTLVFPLYLDYRSGERSYRHIIPVYGHHTRGTTYDRYFILGPSLILTRDTERDLRQWDALFFLGHHRSERGRGNTWVLPLYFSGYDTPDDRFYRYLLPVYGQWHSPSLDHRFLFPVFGTQTDPVAHERRIAVFGLPPLRALDPLPTLALYEHRTFPKRVTDRFFPIYRYASQPNEARTEIDALLLYRHVSTRRDTTDRLFPLYRYERLADAQSLQLSVLGYREFALASYHRDQSGMRTHLFPLYSRGRRTAGPDLDVAVLGYGPLSLYRHQTTLTSFSDRLFPLYAYERNRDGRALSVIGVSDLSLFRWSAMPTVVRHRMFPLYSYRHDRSLRTTDVGALLVYGHHHDPLHTTDRLIPLYLYARDETAQTLDVGILGVSPLTLYRHRTTPAETMDRFFPMYGYHRANGETRFAALGLPPLGSLPALALYEHRVSPTRVSDRFFPVYRYTNDHPAGTTSFNVLGLYQHNTAPEHTRDRFFPLYSFDRRNATRDVAALGYGPVSVFHYRDDGATLSHRLSPFYGYRRRADETRLSLIGLPPLGSLPALALYEHRVSSTRVSDRLSPLYRYTRDIPTDEVRWDALFIYQHRATPAYTKDALLPLYRYEDDRGANTFRLGLIGVPPLTLFAHRAIGADRFDWLFPAYGYHRRAAETRLAAVGLPPLGNVPALALYEHRTSSTRTSDRLSPLYRYVHDRGPDATSLNVLALYHHASTPERTRDTLFPLYSVDRAPAAIDVSVVGYRAVSLFHYVDDGSTLAHRLFPLYLYNRDRRANETVLNAGLLYWRVTTSGSIADIFFPLYGYRRRSDETRFAALGLPPLGDIPALALYEHRSTPDRMTDRFFPLYRVALDHRADTAHVNVLLLYDHESTPTSVQDRLLPLYHVDRGNTRFEISAIGYREFSLFRYVTTDTALRHRFVPIYRYAHDRAAGNASLDVLLLYSHRHAADLTADRLLPLYDYRSQAGVRSLSVLGWSEFALYRHEASFNATRDRLFPLYGYRRTGDEWSLGALGYPPFSLYHHASTPQNTTDRLFPLYSYGAELSARESRLALLGLPHIAGWPTLALYQHEASPRRTLDRLFPLYRYSHDLDKQQTRVGALVLFRASNTPSATQHSLFPLYSYVNDNASQVHRVGVLGYAPFSLYQHLDTSTGTSDRFLPIYTYSYDAGTTEAQLSVLWPLFVHNSRGGRTTETGILWWLVHYEHPDADHRDFHILGGSAMAVFRHRVTPERSVVEFNPVIPLYYREVTPTAARWTLFGGLIGHTTPVTGRGKWQWLWFL